MQANKKEKIVEELISLLINIDKKKFLSNFSKKDKNKIFKYLENELFNLDEIKVLLSSIKYDKLEIASIIYDIIKLYNNKESEVYRKSADLYNLASKNSFNWPSKKSCLDKVEEELLELKMALLKSDKNNIKEELGDIIFTLNSFANLNKINITECLEQANKKFEARFERLLEYARIENINLQLVTSDLKEKLWEKAKKDT
tara:strand:- start:1918 stop:2520 length:603 start_codon:yes stop_codon:yes gene_type:complete